MQNLLEIKNLTINLQHKGQSYPLVNDVNLTIPENEIVGLVGESGSGKTLTALSILQLHQSPQIKITSGEILLDGKNLLKLSKKKLQKIAGNKICMIFQDPMTSLNPLMKLGKQLDEVIKIHHNIPAKERKKNIISLLNLVGFPDPDKRLKQFPHQLSGGLQQRVMIAMALLNNPRLLIADEPTTALDVTTQAQILRLLLKLKEKYNISILFISHDLLLISKITRLINIMYAGEIVESGKTDNIFNSPFHPYTKGLLDALPQVEYKNSKKTIKPIPGNIPNPQDRTKGCIFSDRCFNVKEKCYENEPKISTNLGEHAYKCFFPLKQ